MPAVDTRETDSNNFQLDFILCDGLDLLFAMITSKTFLHQGDTTLKRYL